MFCHQTNASSQIFTESHHHDGAEFLDAGAILSFPVCSAISARAVPTILVLSYVLGRPCLASEVINFFGYSSDRRSACKISSVPRVSFIPFTENAGQNLLSCFDLKIFEFPKNVSKELVTSFDDSEKVFGLCSCCLEFQKLTLQPEKRMYIFLSIDCHVLLVVDWKFKCGW